MQSSEIEAALRKLLGDAAASPGLIVTLRRHDEYERLLERISALEQEIEELKQEVHRMSMYALRYFSALDELKICSRLLREQGVDTSFIQSLRR